MQKHFISIGCQCTTSTILNKLNLKNHSYRFDWIFSNPLIVYEILNLIFDKDINIEELTSSIFFNIDNMCSDATISCSYIDNVSGSYYLNKKSNIVFPHEQNLTIDEIKQKYTRRFNEFKHVILDKNNFIYFVYVSQPSLYSGNFIINNEEIITDIYYNLDKFVN